ncbi:hypothetical protein IF1G_05789 [Cordyceps javanica]|uniref:CCHC-type domain-containing protein n=1 Tax=Cordyceps javanica TaxID=43265 RepID=A0A545V2L5_9HYPO|nr:hypothetical protein IF1G_05789 [Cordyceps javanica]TQW06841.1 hypothetical protein IF2G_05225 [Cordyceps javanica]
MSNDNNNNNNNNTGSGEGQSQRSSRGSNREGRGRSAQATGRGSGTHARPTLNEQSRLVEMGTSQMRYLSTTDALHQGVREVQSIPGLSADAVWEVRYTYRGLQGLDSLVQSDDQSGPQPLSFPGMFTHQVQQQPQPQQQPQQLLQDLGGQALRRFLAQQLPRRVPAANPSSGSGFASTQPAKSRGGKRGGKKPSGGIGKGTPTPTPPGTSSPRRGCGNCGAIGHRVQQCCHPWADGFVHGCPQCNAADHHTEAACRVSWPTIPKAIFSMAVRRRANRPPLLAFRNWPEIYQAAIARDVRPLPEAVPWTPWFAQQILRRDPHFTDWPWRRFNCVLGSQADLPEDEISRRAVESAQSADSSQLEVLAGAMASVSVAEGGPWDGQQPLPSMPAHFPGVDVKVADSDDDAAVTGNTGHDFVAQGDGNGSGAVDRSLDEVVGGANADNVVVKLEKEID